MRRALFAAVIAAALGLYACAGSQPRDSSTAVTSLKADPQQVVAISAVRPVDGITSSGQPDEAALRVYAESGYVAVIDLRTAKESRGFDEAAVVEELGMDYVSLPVAGKPGISFDNATKLDAVLDKYQGPVLVHCGSGNRVGALLTLMHVKDGMDEEAALATGRSAGLTGLESTVREVLHADQ